MAWGVGANDVANAMGTSVGSRALTIRQAILVAMVFEFCGAYFAGGEVTETIRSGIVDPQYMTPDLLVFGMLGLAGRRGLAVAGDDQGLAGVDHPLHRRRDHWLRLGRCLGARGALGRDRPDRRQLW